MCSQKEKNTNTDASAAQVIRCDVKCAYVTGWRYVAIRMVYLLTDLNAD